MNLARLRAKLSCQAGFTLVELLACALASVILALILTSGMKVAADTQRATTSASEIEVLESSLTSAVTDELRYARNLKFEDPANPSILTSFDSMNFGKNARFVVPNSGEAKGQLCIETGTSTINKILSTAAYGDATGNASTYTGAFDVTAFHVTYDKATGVFSVIMRLQDKGEGSKGAVSQVDFQVKRLNATAEQDALAT